MNFSELAKINVNAHVEKKNNLSYLSWAWAVDTLLKNAPLATWTYAEPKAFGDTLMVFCTVKAFGKEMTAQLPVMDYKNKAIPNPDAMAVNTAMQRALAKAIALHGIGLYIYAGEDIPGEAPAGGLAAVGRRAAGAHRRRDGDGARGAPRDAARADHAAEVDHRERRCRGETGCGSRGREIG